MPVDLAAVEERREDEADLALGGRLERAGVDLAVGHVVAAVRRLPAAGPRRRASGRCRARRCGARGPRARRVGAGAAARRATPSQCATGSPGSSTWQARKTKRSYSSSDICASCACASVGKRHAEPAELAGGHPLPAPLGELAARRRSAAGAAPGRRASARGCSTPTRSSRSRRRARSRPWRSARRIELLVVGLGEQQLGQPLELEVDVRVRARPRARRGRSRPPAARPPAARRCAAPCPAQAERVVDDELAEPCDARVGHLSGADAERPADEDARAARVHGGAHPDRIDVAAGLEPAGRKVTRGACSP